MAAATLSAVMAGDRSRSTPRPVSAWSWNEAKVTTSLFATIYERFDVARETALDTGGWLLELALDPAQVAWLNQQSDFRPEYFANHSPTILAPTGSLS